MHKLRGAIVGYGFIMQEGHAAGYRQRADVDIVAIADVAEERRAAARADWPEARIYDDYQALLDGEGGRLDFVDVATPPADHAAVTLAGLDRGLHVLCEKPLAASIDEARAMLRGAARAERVVYPCHNYRHAPVIKAVRAILDSGRIGKVHLVTLQTFRNTHAKGVAGFRPDWRRERRLSGGGIAMDHGSHTFYLAFDWLGGYPTAITARAATTPRTTSRAACGSRRGSRRRTCRGTRGCARCSTPSTASGGRCGSRTTTSRWPYRSARPAAAET